jgi:hypothetical protein
MNNNEKDATLITVGSIAVILIGMALFTTWYTSDDFDSNRTYDSQFQIVNYTYYKNYDSITITLKDENSNKIITASVPRDCVNQPVNKIIDATVTETTKDLFGLTEKNNYKIISGKVCM